MWSVDKEALSLGTILSSGHNTLLSARLYRALVRLAELTVVHSCQGKSVAASLRAVAANISSGFEGRSNQPWVPVRIKRHPNPSEPSPRTTADLHQP